MIPPTASLALTDIEFLAHAQCNSIFFTQPYGFTDATLDASFSRIDNNASGDAFVFSPTQVNGNCLIYFRSKHLNWLIETNTVTSGFLHLGCANNTATNQQQCGQILSRFDVGPQGDFHLTIANTLDRYCSWLHLLFNDNIIGTSQTSVLKLLP